MTKKQIEKLTALHERGCTDSDIIDFCHDNKVKVKEAFHFISILMAPECCKKCLNVDFYPSMPPCSSCRRPRPDRFKGKDDTVENHVKTLAKLKIQFDDLVDEASYATKDISLRAGRLQSYWQEALEDNKQVAEALAYAISIIKGVKDE